MLYFSKDNKIDIKYILITLFAVLFSWLLHEFAHWVTGTLLGYDMAMTLNTAYPLNEKYNSKYDEYLISAAGPVVTILQGLIVFYLMNQKKRRNLYPFLFICFYMRLLATIISSFNPNDEARISQGLGLGTFTLPIIVTLILFILLLYITRQYRFNFKLILITIILIIIFTSVIILSNQFFELRLI